MSSTFTSPAPECPETPPEDYPERRANSLLETYHWLAPEKLRAAAIHIVTKNAGFQSRWRHLIALADKFNAAISERATCQKGCSYCCSMQTLIYRHEAILLSRASGRTYVELPFRPHDRVLAEMYALPFRPCPFLVSGKCSVYARRPMICRLHHSFNDNPRDCDQRAPRVLGGRHVMFDPDLIEMSYHALIRGHSPQEPWGTIHQFFPD